MNKVNVDGRGAIQVGAADNYVEFARLVCTQHWFL